MKATIYQGAHDIRVENVPEPQIGDPNDAIVRVTRAAICGSDLVEAVGNEESLDLAVGVARPGGTISFVGVPHNVKAPPIPRIFYHNLSLRGGVAPARSYIPQLIAGLEAGRIDPSPVLDLALPLSQVADGYAAMDARKSIKVLLTVS
jgi:threonine dehydrogenase-like Zn-dependent dehydrogenase